MNMCSYISWKGERRVMALGNRDDNRGRNLWRGGRGNFSCDVIYETIRIRKKECAYHIPLCVIHVTHSGTNCLPKT